MNRRNFLSGLIRGAAAVMAFKITNFGGPLKPFAVPIDGVQVFESDFGIHLIRPPRYESYDPGGLMSREDLAEIIYNIDPQKSSFLLAGSFQRSVISGFASGDYGESEPDCDCDEYMYESCDLCD